MQQGSRPRLPVELWQIVIQNLGCSPYRNILSPLLTVSRTIYSIAIPLIYESILIDDKENIQTHCPKRSTQPSTHLWTSRVNLLHFACVANPSLAKHIKTLVEMYADFEPSHQICLILPLLTNLKKLYIVHERARSMRSILSNPTKNSPTLTLTHFSCAVLNPEDHEVFKAFLLSQRSSLTFLSLSSVTEALDALPPSSLERLHTFQSNYPDNWGTAVNVAPIRHLETFAFCALWVHGHKAVFRDIVSLKIAICYEIDVIKVIGPYLRSLEWLYLSFLFDMKQHLEASHFMDIASARLSYVHFARNTSTISSPPQPRYSRDDLQPLYDHHPCLRVIDIAYREVQENTPNSSDDAKVSRYFRDDTKSTRENVIIPTAWMFEGWWEPLRAELELEYASP